MSMLPYAWAGKAMPRTVAVAGILTLGSFVGSRVGDAVGIAYVSYSQPVQAAEASIDNLYGYAHYTPVVACDIAGGLIGLGAAALYKRKKSK